MPKSEKQKLKILYVAKFFMENSDENTPVAMKDIISYLRENGIEAERRSIYRDIDLLRDELGIEIESTHGGNYRLMSRMARSFEFEDLRILAASVYAAKFISESSAKELVSRIGEFCSATQADELEQEVFLCERARTTQKSTLYTIATIQAAMSQRWGGEPHTPSKITFKYLKYTLQNVGEQVERRKGAAYKVSPFKLLINDGNYYLLAYDDQAQDMRTYRVDRMKDVREIDEPREGAKVFAELDMESYTQRVFSMYGGEKKRVSIRFVNTLLDSVIERFGMGKDVFYRPDDKGHFVVNANVEISDPFFSWICTFRKRAVITSPPDVIQEMQKFLQDVESKYEVAEK